MDVAMPAWMMRLWTAGTRIACFLAVTMPFAASARTILVPAQPVSPFADTEVSTNIVLHASRTDTREFGIHIQLAGTPTNNLEVAFGRDTNTNGVLDVQEIDTVYGWRGGRYFIENVPAWERIEVEAATNALCSVCDIHLENNSSVVPRRFTATCGISPERSEPRQRSLEGCVAAFPELATMPPAWLFREEWDMVRVTRRGAGVPSEWVRCDIEYASFAIRLR
ncbi:MAG: hypothetical protein IJI73_05720 [Kiritimatiellae bacterium]|nr:hypothetical protein [Kiritimatiellia bacterium]